MLTELAALLDLLKAKGVQSYRGALSSDDALRALAVELTFAPPAPLPDDKDAKTEDPDMCGCGHSMTAHQGGLCLEGCEEEKCA